MFSSGELFPDLKRMSVRKIRKTGDLNGEAETSNIYDEETQKALEEMDRFENELDSVNELACEEILKVEQKFSKVRKPIFEKRSEIIPRIPLFWVTAVSFTYPLFDTYLIILYCFGGICLLAFYYSLITAMVNLTCNILSRKCKQVTVG